MTKTIVPIILEKLESYLELADKAWESQPSQERIPTLPYTSDGKVNVRAIVKALGLRQSQEQHFFRKIELLTPINALARVQGLKLIGSRVLTDQTDLAISKRIAKLSKDRNDFAQALAELTAQNESLRVENKALRAQLTLRDENGIIIRTTWPKD